jgi:threonine dehydrogenase-like Zn-dependent dehydrogenase
MTSFTAPEYQADGTIRPARYVYTGSTGAGWEITREGRLHLRLGLGYRLLRTSHCGICATDLARRHLPFALPQITGHEVVAVDEDGAPVAVEINASHRRRDLAPAAWCRRCREGLDTHCPERLVLGIHDLPGGFAPWILAPAAGVVPIPGGVSATTATLVEPFAAALHAVQAIAPRDGMRVAVLGPRRLGSLVIAALATRRQETGGRYEILAIPRRRELGRLAADLGADAVLLAEEAARGHDIADVVVDTTGDAAALPLAVRLAKREVHVKSTSGRAALGLAHLTAMVVDEMTLCPWAADVVDARASAGGPVRTAVVLGTAARARVEDELRARRIEYVVVESPAALAEMTDQTVALLRDGADGVDLAVVASSDTLDAAIRPWPGRERGLVRPRGTIAVVDVGQARDGVLSAVLDKGIRFTTSRCGDARAAVRTLADSPAGLGQVLGERLVTDVVPAERLAEAFGRAAGRRSIKIVVTQPNGLLPS